MRRINQKENQHRGKAQRQLGEDPQERLRQTKGGELRRPDAGPGENQGKGHRDMKRDDQSSQAMAPQSMGACSPGSCTALK